VISLFENPLQILDVCLGISLSYLTIVFLIRLILTWYPKIELNKSDRFLSWLPITKSRIKKYPYMGVATMALGAIIFLVSGGANSIN